MANRNLYTFGYEGQDIAGFIARLLEVGVQSVVDVRELPLSRKKGFSKSMFRERLAEAGIAYFHVPALGCPKEIRHAYRADSNWKIYTRKFLAYLETQEATVQELAKFSRTTAACLVCFEADHMMCHRTYVARAAKQHGASSIMHITAETVAPDRPLRLVA